ncbi:MAG: hypothetical protein IPK50_09585 [Fibrobacterota bacterium]|nr:hypothetical protein [Fibrobacterota bacterium]QQS07130.1 MAG: hypothetical protein IPK50_09585 [Fibrobacterota bacterium]
MLVCAVLAEVSSAAERFATFQPCPVDSADVELEHVVRSRRHPDVDGRFSEGFCWKEYRGEEAKRRFLASQFHSVSEPVDLPVTLDSLGHPTVTPESAKATFEWIFQHIGRGFGGVVGITRRHAVAREGLRFSLSTTLNRPNAKGPVLELHGEVVVHDTLALRLDLQRVVKKNGKICQESEGASWCVGMPRASSQALHRALTTPADRGVSSPWGVHAPSLKKSDSGSVYFALPPEPFMPLDKER